jgi:hypothetical protein
MAVMPAMVTMMAMMPSHLGRRRLDIFLHGRGSTGIAQRERAGALGRRGDSEQCANGSKAQNFRHLHV